SVWHLSEDPTGSIKDSTSNSYNGASQGSMNSADQIEGQIDGSLNFDGINDYIDFGNPTGLQITGAITVEAWFRANSIGNTYLISKNGPSGQRGWDISFDAINSTHGYLIYRYALNGNTHADDVGNITIPINQWHHVVGVFKPSDYSRLFFNGQKVDENTTNILSSQYDAPNPVRFGTRGDIPPPNYFNGTIDEVRISNIARSANWIITEFNNQKDPSNFYNIGNESIIVKHPPNANYFNRYKVIQINHTKVNGSSTLNNFPLLISLLDSDLHRQVRSDGNDIKFAMDGNWLDHEIELFNKTYSGSQAQLISWVRIPSLSPFTDTLIYIYYGNSTMGAQENPSGVWDSSYKGIWHLSEDPTETIYDSTSNNNDGTTSGSMNSNDQINGQIDGSLDLDGINDYVTTNYAGITGSNARTISFWMNTSSLDDRDIISYGSFGANRFIIRIDEISGGGSWVIRLEMKDATTLREQVWSTHVADGNWHYVVVAIPQNVDISQTLAYIDGQLDTIDQTLGSGTANSGSGGIYNFQMAYYMNKEYFNGTLDEVRVSNTNRSADWITTEYNNQYDPDGFYTLSERFLVSDDIQGPDIQINSPVEFELFGQTSPAYNVSIDDYSGIDTMWYILSNGTFNTTLTIFTELTGNINQTRWDELGNGTVTILFYANDTRGNLDHSEVTVRKDNVLPYVDITAPAYDGEQVGGDPISISGNANGTESIIESIYINDTRWGDGSQKPQIDPSGSIEGQFRFDNNTNISPGSYSVEINITDAAGNVNSSIRKFQVILLDVTKPILIITSISPDPSNGFTNITVVSNENLKFPPLLNITLPNSSVIYRPMRVIGPLTWCANYTVDSNEIHTVQINGTDTADNIGYTSDTFEGDITAPSMVINTPTLNDLYGNTPPTYNLTVTDVNLNSFWYTLDGGVTNSTPVSVLGTINQFMWDAKGNGTITIRFYANDSAGNVNFTEIEIRKDIIIPLIEITDPTDYELYGEDPPDVTIYVNEPNLDRIWYQLENASLTTDNSTWVGLIPQSTWDLIGNGTVIIRFYVNDTAGNINNTVVIIYKDITIPDIVISTPTPNNAFNENSPDFAISVSGSNLNERWYTLDDGVRNYTFTGLSGRINQSEWVSQGDGIVMIKFYLTNKLGLVGFDEIQVIKDTITPSVTINLPQNNTYCGTVPFINVLASDSNLDTIWYRVATFNVKLQNNVDQRLEDSIWSMLPEDWFSIYIFANDTVGHVNNLYNLTLYKDITRPSSPTIVAFPQGDVKLPIIFDWEDGTDISGISYYRLIIDNEVDPFTTPGVVFEVLITNEGTNSSYYKFEEELESGEYYFFLYQIDGADHQSYSFSGSFTIGLAAGNPQDFPYWIIIIIIGAIVGLAIGIVAVKKTKKDMTPPRRKIHLKIISSHINKLSHSQPDLKTNKIQSISSYDKQAELLTSNELTDEKDIENYINHYKNLGEELFADGAYLEAQEQFKRGRDFLLNLQREEEAKLFSDLVYGIEELVGEREKRLEALEQFKIEGNVVQIFEMYQDIIEISKKLRDPDSSSFYQSELINYFQTNKVEVVELEKYRFELNQKADSLVDDNLIERATQIYEVCKKISQLFAQLGREGEIRSDP
ncbi:MAG: LamG-like jellyroll fold domain-containing protein, partial [Promethearchaeota archaeon]